jgi:hypothetical protein
VLYLVSFDAIIYQDVKIISSNYTLSIRRYALANNKNTPRYERVFLSEQTVKPIPLGVGYKV